MSRRRVAAALLVLCLAGCDSVYTASRNDVLGPVEVSIQVVASSEDEAQEAIAAAFDAIIQANNLLSSYVPNSEVTRLNESGGTECHISSQTESVLRRSAEISELTGGAFDVTAGPVIKLWKEQIKIAEDGVIGLTEEEPKLPDKRALEAARGLVGHKRLTLGPNTATLGAPGMRIDLGGIAKGHAVDQAVAALKKKGIRSALVDAGGDGYALGTRPGGSPWRIGVQGPDDAPGEYLPDVLRLADMAYATSGDYQQYAEIGGVRYTHIIDPRTGQPARVAASVTVVAPDCTTADALATGISVLGPKDGVEVVKKLPGVECMVITREDSGLEQTTSSGFHKLQTAEP